MAHHMRLMPFPPALPLMTRLHSVPFQSTLRTPLSAARVLSDLARLEAPGATVAERSDTYLVFAPVERTSYGAGRATLVAAAVAIVVLAITAVSVVWIALLPLALAAYLPLLIDDHPLIAIGAVDDDVDGITRLTVHGHAWGALATALDAYLAGVPEAPPPPADDDPGSEGADATAAVPTAGA